MAYTTLFLIAIILSACCSVAFSQQLLNNIIRFGSVEARQSYVDLLKEQDPGVETINIDTVFIGLITKHSTAQTFSIESRRLDRMFIAGSMSILGFERDQVYTVSLADQPSPPWHLDRINQDALPLDQRFSFDPANDPINIYIADTGVRITHNEFEGRASGAFSAVSGKRAGEDCHGHGTHVAALAAGKTYGVAKQARIFDVRVLDCQGSGSTSGIIQAMDWVARNAQKPAVINMSLGGSFSQTLNNAITSLARAGVLPIVAAGNENQDACSTSPASAPEALTIGATDNRDGRSSFSNYGRCVDMYSPGSSITSAGITSDSSTATMSGTSMASPIAAGVAAYVLSKNPSFSAEQLTAKVLEIANKGVGADISPFVYYRPQEGGEQPEDPTDPEDPTPAPEKPTSRMIVAFLEGDAFRMVRENTTVVFDGSLSHASRALNRELCGSDEELFFAWSCVSGITHSERKPTTFCEDTEFDTESVLTLSHEQVAAINGKGPVVFTMTAAMGGYSSQARVVVDVKF